MKKHLFLPLIVTGALLYAPNTFAQEPIMVAKTLGLSKLSESYLLSEQLAESISKENNIGVGILSGNNCTEVSCQVEKAKSSKASLLITIEISKSKKKTQSCARNLRCGKRKIKRLQKTAE